MPAPATIQFDLALFTSENTDAILRLLNHTTTWLSATAILSRLGLENTESNRRLIRKVAETLGSDLISGQLGYRHIDHATPDEVRHFANWMRSQGDKMTTRANAALSRKGIR